MSLRIVCRNYIRQNYSWECWRKFCVLVGGGDDDGSESGKRGAAFRWSQCVPKSKYHSDCWFHICQNRIPSSYHTTCSHTHTHTRSTNYACMRLSYKTRSLFFPLSRRLVCVYKCKYKWSESADFIPIFKNDDNGSRICFESGFSFLFILKSIYLGWFASVTCSSLFFRLFSSFVFKIFSHRGWCFFFSLHSPAFSLSFIVLVIEIDTRWNAFFQIDWN